MNWWIIYLLNGFPIAFLLILFLNKLIKRFEAFKIIVDFSKTLPGPTFRELIRNAKRERILPWLTELRAKHGRVFRIWFGNHLFVFFSDPEHVKYILNSTKILTKSNNYELVEPWLGKGLLTNGGAAWHERRKMLTPAFHFKILSAFKQSMEDNCDILIRKLSQHLTDDNNVDGFNVYPYITLYALDTICETAMGIKKHAQLKCDSEYVKAVKTICSVFHQQSFNFWYRFEFIFKRSSAGKLRDSSLKILHTETERVIELRREMLSKENISSKQLEEKDDGDGNIGVKKRLAFLDMLLLAQNDGMNITDTEIREEVDTFMFEGHDTISSALAFTLYLLSQNSDVQQKAYDEVMRNSDKLDSLKYLDAVIKESMRLYPPVPFFSRALTEPTFVDNILLPKGSAVSVLAYLLHRNPIEFPEPEKFKPERYLDTDKQHHPYSYVAFSAGPRNCIGQKFAMLELRCTLTKLLKEFEFLPVENFKPILVAELILKSQNGIYIKLRKRK